LLEENHRLKRIFEGEMKIVEVEKLTYNQNYENALKILHSQIKNDNMNIK
jgi:hypothetical protein